MGDKALKKSILVVSFGTIFTNAGKITIEVIENRIKNKYAAYEVRRAFTSQTVIKILKNRYGIFVDTPEEALKKLYEDGYEEVFILPLHLIPGSEYGNLKSLMEIMKKENLFKKVKLGTPAIYSNEDYELLIGAIKDIIDRKEAVIFMGHGSYSYSNKCYLKLQALLNDKGYKNVFIGVMEGQPSIKSVINWVKENKIKEVMLVPLMLVAGTHVKKDMCDNENSWKKILEKEEIKVKVYLHGLGELAKFQEIYLKHLEKIISVV